MIKIFTRSLTVIFLMALIIASCSKSDPNPNPVDPCASKNIVITAVVTPASSPTNNNGSIAATASGSNGFSYNINNGAFQSGGTFNNLAAGTYTISVKDADGCTKSNNFTVTATSCPTITVTATLTAASNTTATDGVIAATATGSTGFTYNVNGGPFQASGTFAGLAIGSYTVTAKDANGCLGSAIFLVVSAACPTIVVNTTVTATTGPTATNGIINSTASGGVSPYTFSKDGGVSFQASGSFTNLATGNYTIVAKDANDCLGTSGTITVTSACPTITITNTVLPSDKCTNNTGSINVAAIGSSGFTFSLNGGTFQGANAFTALAMGTYNVAVKDLNGCTVTQNATVPMAAAGVRFSDVKAILSANCATPGCHVGASPQSGINLADDCTIVNQRDRIRARAVDGSPSFMPPAGQLSATDKQRILDWVNAGGQHSNN